VLTVVGILAAVAVPTFNTVKENSAVRSAATMAATIGRDADAISDSQGISFGAALAIAVDEHNDAAANDFAALDDNGDGTRLVAGGYRNAASKGYVRSYQWQ